MTDKTDYKVDKCLEKIHEVQLGMVELRELVKRMNKVEQRLDRIESRMFKMAIVFAMVLSALAAHYSPELLKLIKVII